MNSALTIKRVKEGGEGGETWYWVLTDWGQIVASYRRREDAEDYVLRQTVCPDS